MVYHLFWAVVLTLASLGRVIGRRGKDIVYQDSKLTDGGWKVTMVFFYKNSISAILFLVDLSPNLMEMTVVPTREDDIADNIEFQFLNSEVNVFALTSCNHKRVTGRMSRLIIDQLLHQC